MWVAVKTAASLAVQVVVALLAVVRALWVAFKAAASLAVQVVVAKNHLSSQVGKESPPVKLRKALQNSLQPRGLNLGLMLWSNEIWRGP